MCDAFRYLWSAAVSRVLFESQFFRLLSLTINVGFVMRIVLKHTIPYKHSYSSSGNHFCFSFYIILEQKQKSFIFI